MTITVRTHTLIMTVFVFFFLLALPGMPAWGRAATSARSVSEALRTAQDATKHRSARVEAIRSLGNQNRVADIRAQRVVDALARIAGNATERLWVRMEAVTVAGQLQTRLYGADDSAKNIYRPAFERILEGPSEPALLRAAVCDVFGATLAVGRPGDGKAVGMMIKLAWEPSSRTAPNQPPRLVRLAAIRALGNLITPDAFAPLAGVLTHPASDPALKAAAVHSISRILISVTKLDPRLRIPTLRALFDVSENPDLDAQVRGDALRALATLYRRGVKGVDRKRLMGTVEGLLKEGLKAEQIVPAIETLGLMGDTGNASLLKKVYEDFYDPEMPCAPKDVTIRVAVMQTLGELLTTQEREAKEAAVLEIAQSLLLPLRLEKKQDTLKWPESNAVMQAAIFSLRDLYPAKQPFEEARKRAAERLIALLKHEKLDKQVRAETAKTLYCVTEQDWGLDAKRWKRWFDKRYRVVAENSPDQRTQER